MIAGVGSEVGCVIVGEGNGSEEGRGGEEGYGVGDWDADEGDDGLRGWEESMMADW